MFSAKNAEINNNNKKIIMKKIIACLVLGLAVLGCQAQDTLTLQDIRGITRYGFAPGWPDFPDGYTAKADGSGYYCILTRNILDAEHHDADAFYEYSEDTILVYGVAAVVDNQVNYQNIPDGVDTSTKNSYTWLMLYEAEPGSLRPLVDTARMYVHTWQPPTYYLALDLWQQNAHPPAKAPVVPMYERYFQEPVEVADSFYVGFVHRRKGDHLNHYSLLASCSFLIDIDDFNREKRADYLNYFDGDVWRIGWRYRSTLQMRHMIFPILAPPDTNGDDNQGVVLVDPVSRYTNVTPNPAKSTIRVSSSFGLTAIEAFDAKGHRVYHTEANGLVWTMDVSQWPKGLYVFRIETKSGIATKKVIVQ